MLAALATYSHKTTEFINTCAHTFRTHISHTHFGSQFLQMILMWFNWIFFNSLPHFIRLVAYASVIAFTCSPPSNWITTLRALNIFKPMHLCTHLDFSSATQSVALPLAIGERVRWIKAQNWLRNDIKDDAKDVRESMQKNCPAAWCV